MKTQVGCRSLRIFSGVGNRKALCELVSDFRALALLMNELLRIPFTQRRSSLQVKFVP